MIIWKINLIYHLKLYKSSSKPTIDIATAKKPIYKKLLSACPRSLVDIKNAIEHAIPPNGGTYLEESLSSFFLMLGTKIFDFWRVVEWKSMESKSVASTALVMETWNLDKFTFVALDLAS